MEYLYNKYYAKVKPIEDFFIDGEKLICQQIFNSLPWTFLINENGVSKEISLEEKLGKNTYNNFTKKNTFRKRLQKSF